MGRVKGVEDFIIYNSVGFIKATSNRMKRNFESKLKLNGFATFSLRIKKPYVVNEPIVITTMEGLKFLLYELMSDDDLKAISNAEKLYFGSQKEFETYLGALATAKGLIVPMATRPTTLYLLSVAEKYGIKIPTNVHEHKPVLHIVVPPVTEKELVNKVINDYDAMFAGKDTNSPLTEFYFTDNKKGVVSRRLNGFNSQNVVFEDGSFRVKEIMSEKFGDKIAEGLMRWTAMS